MPIARRSTPPTSKLKTKANVLGSLSAWTANEDPEDDDKAEQEGYRLLQEDKSARRDIGSARGFEGVDSPEADSGDPISTSQMLYTYFVAPLKLSWRIALDPDHDNFNVVVGLVIIGNAIVIGFETDLGRGKFTLLEHMFNAVFCFEMCLRIRKLHGAYFLEAWNLFDFALVLIGTLDLWIMPLLLLLIGDTLTNSGAKHVGYHLVAFRLLRVMRVLRVLRVLRVIRVFRMFQQLYLIMQAFGKAFQIVLLMAILIFILDYVTAIILTQAIGQHKDLWEVEDRDLIESWFGTIVNSMNTLFIVMTLSDWELIATVLVKVVPSPIVFFSFVGYIMVTSYTMVSLITGIISESLMTSQQEYKRRQLLIIDKKRKLLQKELSDFLHEILEDNVDSDGCVDHNELKQFVRGDQDLLLKMGDIGVSVAENGILSLVDKISGDGKARVNIDYFVDKLTNITGNASMSSLVDLKHNAVRTQKRLAKLDEKFTKLAEKMWPAAVGLNKEPEADQQPQEIVRSRRPSIGADGLPKRSSLRIPTSDRDPKEIRTTKGKARFADDDS